MSFNSKSPKQYIRNIKVNNHSADNHEPANGEPKMPTASSAHSRKNPNIAKAHIMILFLMLLTLLITNSQMNPVPYNRNAMITKSLPSQLTPLSNCMAINGINNKIETAKKIMMRLLFFINIKLNDLISVKILI